MNPRLQPCASILAVGTELTQGQITNRNATWISEALTAMGIQVACHLTVEDDQETIEWALRTCFSKAPLLFVTGGLGPTTDDFTRDVIARYFSTPLIYDPTSFDRIFQRLTERGVPVAESNKRQCFFPEKGTILINPAGTANGFMLRTPNQLLIALPGPPNEGKAIWGENQLNALLEFSATLPEKETLFTWQTLGISESALGEIVEEALAGSRLKTGYRAHQPFVEIKVWVPSSRLNESKPWLLKLEEKIAPWFFAKKPDDYAKKLWETLSRSQKKILVVDALGRGLLQERLLSTRPQDLGTGATPLQLCTLLNSDSEPAAKSQSDCLTLALLSDPDELKARARIQIPNHPSHANWEVVLESPWKGGRKLLGPRIKGGFVEMALKVWAEQLATLL